MFVTPQQQIQILHVDDDPKFAELTGEFIQREDDRFTVETATSAEEGLHLINERLPDCVVSDYNMPGMDGLEFLQAVRAEYSGLPFILFTGKGSEAVASDAISAGVTDYLQKQGNTEQYELLANRIQNVVTAQRDAKEASRQRDLMRRVEVLGATGGWELQVESEAIRLTDGIKQIYDVDTSRSLSLEEVMGFYEPDAQREIRSVIDDAIEDGYGEVNDLHLQTANGEKRVVEGTAELVENDSDSTVLRGVIHDITDRVEREQTARQRQQELSLFFEESPLGVVQWDDEFRFERVNAQAEAILGYTEPELRGESWETIVATEDYDKVGTVVETLLDADGGAHVLNQNVRKDGERITAEWHNRAVTDANGNVQSVFSMFQDVTTRENRKRELEEFETIIEALTDAVYVLDEDGRFTYVNDEFVELVGYDRETILGNTPSLIKGREAVEQAENQLSQLLSSDGPDTVTFEVTVHPHDDDPVVCEDHMGVLPYDGDEFDGSVGTLRDITERKRRERTLHELQHRTEQLIRASTEEEIADIAVTTAHDVLELSFSGVHLTDDERNVLEPTAVTDEVREYLGEAPAYDRTSPEDSVDAVSWEIFEGGETVVIEDTHDSDWTSGPETATRSGIIQPLDEHGLFITSSPKPHAFDEGDVALMEIFATIVTAVLDRNERETTLRDRTQRLEVQRDRLNKFASIVSHDLRNPLNVAEGRLELAREEYDSEHLEPVDRALERMDALIDDILTLAREGETATDLEPVDLTALVEDCWNNVETADITLATSVNQAIYADRSRLKQVFENLIRNAVEHSGDEVTVTIGELEEGFYIEDNGVGIPESKQEEVFNMGYSTNEDGTGFGLSIVKQVVEAHSWEINVTKSAEGGARFEVTGVEFTTQ